MRADRFAFTTLVLLMLSTTAFAPSRANAYCRLTTSMTVAGATCSKSGNPLYWPKQCINYSVAPRTGTPAFEDIRQIVDDSFTTWTESECSGHRLGMSVIQTDDPAICETPQYNEEAGNVNAIIFVRNWAERKLPAEAFGLTLVWHRKQSGVIVDADMQLNETLGTLDICGTKCAKGSVDLQNIITHEAGHFLGLGHSDHLNACMYGKAEVGETSKRYLSRDDLDGICAVYGTLAEPTCSESDFAPDNGQGSECTFTSGHQRTCACAVVGSRGREPSSVLLVLACLLAPATLILRRRRRQRR